MNPSSPRRPSLRIRLVLPILLAASALLADRFESKGPPLTGPAKDGVVRFLAALKSGKPAEVARLVVYPLKRGDWLPPVRSEKEFVARFREIFDRMALESLGRMDFSEWSADAEGNAVYGTDLLKLDEKGRIVERSDLGEEEAEASRLAEEKERNSLHGSVRAFVKPHTEIFTKRFHVRIDSTGPDGSFQARYASWPADADVKAKPALVLTNAAIDPTDGPAFWWRFDNGGYSYSVITTTDRESPFFPGLLRVSQGAKILLEEKALRVVRP